MKVKSHSNVTFVTTYVLKRASVHEEKKPFKCDICDYRCSYKGSMNRHVSSVHEEKKPFKCDICDYSFSQKSVMKSHVESVHGGKKAVL